MQEWRWIADALQEELTHGGSAVLLTVLWRQGSTPRGAGAKMLVRHSAPPLGTIGGGAAEHAAGLRARQLLQEGRSGRERYLMRPGEAADLGMVCGGEMEVYFQHFSADDPSAIEAAASMRAQLQAPEDSWFVTRPLHDGWQWGILRPLGWVAGNIGLSAEALMPLCGKTPRYEDPLGCMVEPLVHAGCVCVFGGGHVSQALVPLLAQLDFRVIVFEDRAEFADAALFQNACETRLGALQGAFAERAFLCSDAIIIMTRGHEKDTLVLQEALKTPAYYIGMIGSKSKVAHTRALMRAAGFSDAAFSRVHTPIGLPIQAETPAEIAVSVAAELIAARAAYRNSPGTRGSR